MEVSGVKAEGEGEGSGWGQARPAPLTICSKRLVFSSTSSSRGMSPKIMAAIGAVA